MSYGYKAFDENPGLIVGFFMSSALNR